MRCVAVVLTAGLAMAEPAAAEKSGGILRTYNPTNPPSASIIEEATIATAFSFSGIFNNLLGYDQSRPLVGLDTIVPELAVTWAWDASRKECRRLEAGRVATSIPPARPFI